MSTIEVEHSGSLLTIYVDGVESSAVDLADPAHLEFEYMQQIRIATNAMFTAGRPLRALHLGAAGCALARALEASRPNSRQLAIEIDAELATLVRDWIDLPSAPLLRIRAEDARQTLDTNKGTWHLIVRDTFAAGRIPHHLATVEAHRKAADLLDSEGLYCLNIAGEAGLAPVYREVRALRESFPHVAGISDPAIVKGRRFGNVILIASHRRLPLAEISRHVGRLPLPTVVVSQERLEEAAIGARLLYDRDIGWPPANEAGA
ncbi:spermidine synthase [Trueperella bonasi]|uniref:Spermidine synthase n=1 Tax=Trueperella bonasi TaxID=312286 RepID=A0ABT9NJL3_9ACTO|nr:fused MFS/spermidine synthase [Trueperella bonasi]MDP9807003.1 spermidine synthase [Trueperella bonasi]